MDDPGTMPVRIRPAESAIRLNIRAATAAAASIGMTIGV
jgi:hypothetical protein